MLEKIEKIMREKDINKMELSKGSGISYTTVVNFFENGTENIKRTNLVKLAKYLNCSIDYLANDDIEQDNYLRLSNEQMILLINCISYLKMQNKIFTGEREDRLDELEVILRKSL